MRIKAIALMITAVLFVESAAYGIDLTDGALLRVPLLTERKPLGKLSFWRRLWLPRSSPEWVSEAIGVTHDRETLEEIVTRESHSVLVDRLVYYLTQHPELIQGAWQYVYRFYQSEDPRGIIVGPLQEMSDLETRYAVARLMLEALKHDAVRERGGWLELNRREFIKTLLSVGALPAVSLSSALTATETIIRWTDPILKISDPATVATLERNFREGLEIYPVDSVPPGIPFYRWALLDREKYGGPDINTSMLNTVYETEIMDRLGREGFFSGRHLDRARLRNIIRRHLEKAEMSGKFITEGIGRDIMSKLEELVQTGLFDQIDSGSENRLDKIEETEKMEEDVELEDLKAKHEPDKSISEERQEDISTAIVEWFSEQWMDLDTQRRLRDIKQNIYRYPAAEEFFKHWHDVVNSSL